MAQIPAASCNGSTKTSISMLQIWPNLPCHEFSWSQSHAVSPLSVKWWEYHICTFFQQVLCSEVESQQGHCTFLVTIPRGHVQHTQKLKMAWSIRSHKLIEPMTGDLHGALWNLWTLYGKQRCNGWALHKGSFLLAFECNRRPMCKTREAILSL